MSLFFGFTNGKRISLSSRRLSKVSHVQSSVSGLSTGLFFIFILLLFAADVHANSKIEDSGNIKVGEGSETPSAKAAKDAESAASKTKESLEQIQYYTQESSRSITRLLKAQARLKRVAQRMERILNRKQGNDVPQDILDQASAASATAKTSMDIIEGKYFQVAENVFQLVSRYYEAAELKTVEVLSQAREVSEYAKTGDNNAGKLADMEKLALEAGKISENVRNDTVLVEGVVKDSSRVAFGAERMAFKLEKTTTDMEDALSDL